MGILAGIYGHTKVNVLAPNFNFNGTKYLLRKKPKLIILEPNKIIEHHKNKYEVNQIIY